MKNVQLCINKINLFYDMKIFIFQKYVIYEYLCENELIYGSDDKIESFFILFCFCVFHGKLKIKFLLIIEHE